MKNDTQSERELSIEAMAFAWANTRRQLEGLPSMQLETMKDNMGHKAWKVLCEPIRSAYYAMTARANKMDASARKDEECFRKHHEHPSARTQTPPDSGFDYKRVRAWMTHPDRKPANLAFTSGENRNAAYLIEDYDAFLATASTVMGEVSDCRSVKIKTITEVIPDDGEEGNFFRDGLCWMRDQNGKEYRYIDLAPNFERNAMTAVMLAGGLVAKIIAKQEAALTKAIAKVEAV